MKLTVRLSLMYFLPFLTEASVRIEVSYLMCLPHEFSPSVYHYQESTLYFRIPIKHSPRVYIIKQEQLPLNILLNKQKKTKIEKKIPRKAE